MAAKVDDTLKAERKRSAISTSVLSLSLLVFSGLITFLLFRRVGDLAVRARAWVREHPDRIPALKLGRIEVVRPVAVRGAVSIALALAHRILQFAVVYSWLIFALSRFDATRGYTDRLAGFVLKPLSELIGRVGAALPLFVVAATAAVALGVAVRFVGHSSARSSEAKPTSRGCRESWRGRRASSSALGSCWCRSSWRRR